MTSPAPSPTSVRPSPGLRRRVRDVVVAVAAFTLVAAGAPAASALTPAGIVTSVGAATPAAGPLLTAKQRKVTLTIKPNEKSFRRGEMIWFTGRATASGKNLKGVRVRLQQRTKGAAWKTVARGTTSSSGKFALQLRPSASAQYRIRVFATKTLASTWSKAVTVKRTTKKRTLEDRHAMLAYRLGEASAQRAMSTSQRRAVGTTAVTGVRYRNYEKGTLVEVTRGSSTSTWYVYGKIGTAYRKAGGPTGTYGVPVHDADCSLLEGGCIQRFTKGSLYSKSSKKAAIGQLGKGRKTELIAVARSQVGYSEPAWRRSKYNAWRGSSYAWCGIFQSWVAAAAGHPELIPQSASFPSLVKAVKKNLRTYTKNSKKYRPKQGTLAFFDYSYSRSGATHVGLILAVRKRTVVTLEGNTGKNGSFGNQRGVYIRERPYTKIDFYADPAY